MSDRSERDDDRDDGRVWGYLDGEVFRPLPKGPMLLAEMGPPPFSVTMPDGRVREVIHDPQELCDGDAAH